MVAPVDGLGVIVGKVPLGAVREARKLTIPPAPVVHLKRLTPSV